MAKTNYKPASEYQIAYAQSIAEELDIPLPNEETSLEYFKFISKYSNIYKKVKAYGKDVVEYKEMAKSFLELINKYGSDYSFNEDTCLMICEKLHRKSGIYFLWSGKELVYIGKSINLGDRILSSAKERNGGDILITHISYKVIENKADVHILEPLLITKYKPKLNTEFYTEDTSELFDTKINPFRLKKYKAFIKKEKEMVVYECPF